MKTHTSRETPEAEVACIPEEMQLRLSLGKEVRAALAKQFGDVKISKIVAGLPDLLRQNFSQPAMVRPIKKSPRKCPL